MNNINIKIISIGMKSMYSPQFEHDAEIETANLLCMWIAPR